MPHACRCGRGSRLVPPGHERRATHCVCAPHSPAHFAGFAAREAGAGSGGCGREGSPHATRRGRRWATACAAPCACVRRAGGVSAPWSQRDARRRSATASLRAGGYQRVKKSSNWSSRAKPAKLCEEPGDVRLGWGPRVRREARLPRGARARSKREKGGRPKGHRQPRRRTGCTPETHSPHALQNDTPRPEPAPAGMLQGLPIAAERRAVGWG